MARPSHARTLALVVALAGASLPAAAQSPIAKYSAQVVNFDAPTGNAVSLMQIQITRWSTDEERDRLTNALFEQGEKALLGVVQKLQTAGTIRTPDSVGYPLRYARRTVSSADAETVVIITDRALSFYELRNAPRSREYPFTVIRFQLNSQGRGQGDLMLATRIQGDKATKDIAFENFGPSPLKLQNVRRE